VGKGRKRNELQAFPEALEVGAMLFDLVACRDYSVSASKPADRVRGVSNTLLLKLRLQGVVKVCFRLLAIVPLKPDEVYGIVEMKIAKEIIIEIVIEKMIASTTNVMYSRIIHLLLSDHKLILFE
jgi:hypothetical protein